MAPGLFFSIWSRNFLDEAPGLFCIGPRFGCVSGCCCGMQAVAGAVTEAVAVAGAVAAVLAVTIVAAAASETIGHGHQPFSNLT